MKIFWRKQIINQAFAAVVTFYLLAMATSFIIVWLNLKFHRRLLKEVKGISKFVKMWSLI